MTKLPPDHEIDTSDIPETTEAWFRQAKFSKGNRVMNELPEDRAKAIEAGLAQYQRVAHERDELASDLRKAQVEITRLKVELDALHQQYNLIESRQRSQQAERDHAVAAKACYETLYISINKLLETFVPPKAYQETPHDQDVETAIDDHHKRNLAKLANQLKTLRVPVPEQGPGQG